MTYTIIYSHSADKTLSKLSEGIRKRIIKTVSSIKDKPFSFIEKLKTEKTDELLYKLRVGDYRVIMQVRNDVLTILVVHIDHRKRVYRKF